MLVDTLSDRLSLDPLYELFRNRHVVKVFHAARQDLEIFHTEAGVLPAPFFDTQVAAMVCGYGDQVGYETLVRQIARAQVDKSSRFTDWSRRPLSAAQMTYALADVTHLRRIYEVLSKRLRGDRPRRLGRGGARRPDRSRHLPHRPRRGLDPDQDPLERAALRRGAPRARPPARDARPGPQRAARPDPQGRRAPRARRQPPEDPRGPRQVAAPPARGAPRRDRRRHPRRHRRRRGDPVRRGADPRAAPAQAGLRGARRPPPGAPQGARRGGRGGAAPDRLRRRPRRHRRRRRRRPRRRCTAGASRSSAATPCA